MSRPSDSMPPACSPEFGRVARRRARALVLVTALLGGQMVAREAAASHTSAVDGAVEQLQRYCTTCWKNARVPRAEWSDCTQQVFAELLGVVPARRLDAVFRSADSEERRHAERAIWRIGKRIARSWRQRPASLSGIAWTPRRLISREADGPALGDILDLAGPVLSPRQHDILRRLADGDSIRGIAQALNVAPARVSDEKYRAIVRIRELLGGST